jgi:tripartite-type tricarboxylate transporter receptor subunit TctC
MFRIGCAASVCAGILVASGAGPALGQQNFPSKPIRIVAPGAGGSTDVVGRIIGAELGRAIGQTIIIDNRGNNEIIPGEIVARAPADGYTLLFYGASIWLAPYLRKELPWDPIKDFTPVMAVVSYPNVLEVRPSSPVKSVSELIAAAKAKPGTINYATPGTGSASHLAAEVFRSMTAINVTRINYANPGPAFNDLVSGQVQFMFEPAGSGIGHVKSGVLRALGVSSLTRSKLLPDVPAIAEAGVPGYVSIATNALWAPARTPAPVIAKLNQEIAKVLSKPEMVEKLLSIGTEVVASTPQQFAAYEKAEMVRMGKVIKEANIHDDN